MVSTIISEKDLVNKDGILFDVDTLTPDDVLTLLDCWAAAYKEGMRWYDVHTVCQGGDLFYYFSRGYRPGSRSSLEGESFSVFSFIEEHSEGVVLHPVYAKAMVTGVSRGLPRFTLGAMEGEPVGGTGNASTPSRGARNTETSELHVIGDSLSDNEDNLTTTAFEDDDYADDPNFSLVKYTILIEAIGQTFDVVEGSVKILGRSQTDSDVQLTGNRRLSRKHAEFSIEDGELYITDLGSANHTFLDGLQIRAYEKTNLPVGSRVEMGGAYFVVQDRGTVGAGGDF